MRKLPGVRAVEEMHEKFSNQKSNKNQLEMEVKDAEKRLAAAKKAYNRQEMLFQVAYSRCKVIVFINMVVLVMVVVVVVLVVVVVVGTKVVLAVIV